MRAREAKIAALKHAADVIHDEIDADGTLYKFGADGLKVDKEMRKLADAFYLRAKRLDEGSLRRGRGAVR